MHEKAAGSVSFPAAGLKRVHASRRPRRPVETPFSKEVGIIESPTWTAAFHLTARSQDIVCPDGRGIVLPRLQYGFASVVILVSMLHDRLSVVVIVSYFGFSHPHHHLSSFVVISDIFDILQAFCLVPRHPACLYGL